MDQERGSSARKRRSKGGKKKGGANDDQRKRLFVEDRTAPASVALDDSGMTSQAMVSQTRSVLGVRARTQEDRDYDKQRKEETGGGSGTSTVQNLKTSFWIRNKAIVKFSDEEQEELRRCQQENEDKRYVRDYMDPNYVEDHTFFTKNFGGRLQIILKRISQDNTFLTVDVTELANDMVLDQMLFPDNRNCWTNRTWSKTGRPCNAWHKKAIKAAGHENILPTEDRKKLQIEDVPTEIVQLYVPIARFVVGLAIMGKDFDSDIVYRFLRQHFFMINNKNDTLFTLPTNTTCPHLSIFSCLPICKQCVLGYLGTHTHPWTRKEKTKKTPPLNKGTKNLYSTELGKRAIGSFFKATDNTYYVNKGWGRMSVSQRLSCESDKVSTRIADLNLTVYKVQLRQRCIRAICAAKVQGNLSSQVLAPTQREVYELLAQLSGHAIGTRTHFNKEIFSRTNGAFQLSGIEDKKEAITAIPSTDFYFEVACGTMGYLHSARDTSPEVHQSMFYRTEIKLELFDWQPDPSTVQEQREQLSFDTVQGLLPSNFPTVASAFRCKMMTQKEQPKAKRRTESFYEESFYRPSDNVKIDAWWLEGFPNLVTILKNKPGYRHNGEGPTYQADYSAFDLPDEIVTLLPELQQKLLSTHALDVPGLVGKGMVRRNGNDNLFHSSRVYKSGSELITDVLGRREANTETLGLSLDNAILEACRFSMRYKTRADMDVDFPASDISYRINLNVPDLTKRTMECMHTSYPPTNMSKLQGINACVMRATFSLDEFGHFQRVFTGRMDTADVGADKQRIGNADADKDLMKNWRGKLMYICPGSLVCFDASVPTSDGITVTTGFQYYVEVEIIFHRRNLQTVRDTLGPQFSLHSYLTSKGPAFDLIPEAKKDKVTRVLKSCDTKPCKTTFSATKKIDLPSVVYITCHGQSSPLREAQLDQIDPYVLGIGRVTWFGIAESPKQDEAFDHHPYEDNPTQNATQGVHDDYDSFPEERPGKKA